MLCLPLRLYQFRTILLCNIKSFSIPNTRENQIQGRLTHIDNAITQKNGGFMAEIKFFQPLKPKTYFILAEIFFPTTSTTVT